MENETQKIAAEETIAPKESAAAVETAKKPSKATKGKRKGVKAKKQVEHGKAYVHASYNNTIVTLTDLNGNVIAWASAGSSGFKGPKKATPYAASIVVRNALDKAAAYGLREVSMFVTGVGQGREGAIRAFHAQGLEVASIKDTTSIPHNGCRPPRPRRV